MALVARGGVGWLLTAEPLSPETEAIVRRRLALVSLGCAVVLILLAFIVGLRSAPTDPALSDTEAAAMVVARGLVALGLFAIGGTLLRVAERCLLPTLGGRRDA